MMLNAIKTKDQFSQDKREDLATCFCCEKKFKAGKNQNHKYVLCPVCQKYKLEFEMMNFGFTLF
jgi:hypothetical protein